MTQKMTTELNLNALLSLSCSNPDDYVDYQEAQSLHRQGKSDSRFDPEVEYFRYLGWSRYSIVLHCIEVTVIARRVGEDKYEIREWFIKDH